jgi:hypothetical protein
MWLARGELALFVGRESAHGCDCGRESEYSSRPLAVT